MSNVRYELQRWVEGGSWADQGYESELIPVDLARRVLAEIDELREQLRKQILRRDDQYDRRKIAEFERDIALATLDAVRAELDEQPRGQWGFTTDFHGRPFPRMVGVDRLYRILDGEGDA